VKCFPEEAVQKAAAPGIAIGELSQAVPMRERYPQDSEVSWGLLAREQARRMTSQQNNSQADSGRWVAPASRAGGMA